MTSTGEPRAVEELLPQPQKPKRIEWVFEDGKWKPVEVEGEPAEPSAVETGGLKTRRNWHSPQNSRQKTFRPISDWVISEKSNRSRASLKSPETVWNPAIPRYNIIIRPGDRITVPRDVVGEFWIGGNVNGPNAYPLTGRPDQPQAGHYYRRRAESNCPAEKSRSGASFG